MQDFKIHPFPSSCSLIALAAYHGLTGLAQSRNKVADQKTIAQIFSEGLGRHIDCLFQRVKTKFSRQEMNGTKVQCVLGLYSVQNDYIISLINCTSTCRISILSDQGLSCSLGCRFKLIKITHQKASLGSHKRVSISTSILLNPIFVSSNLVVLTGECETSEGKLCA